MGNFGVEMGRFGLKVRENEAILTVWSSEKQRKSTRFYEKPRNSLNFSRIISKFLESGESSLKNGEKRRFLEVQSLKMRGIERILTSKNKEKQVFCREIPRKSEYFYTRRFIALCASTLELYSSKGTISLSKNQRVIKSIFSSCNNCSIFSSNRVGCFSLISCLNMGAEHLDTLWACPLRMK